MLFLVGCGSDGSGNSELFKDLPSSRTGINFENQLDYTSELNPYTYRNFFNGGGVGLADFNRDGLLDVLFTGNQVDNKLYLNEGDFRFKDITDKAGVASKNVWSTGVSIADINGDGWPDIYICKSGSPGGKNRHNELYINNGDLTFSEQAEEWGLDVVGLSTDATFFDYDRDGDLDMYLLSNSFEPVTGALMRRGSRTKPDPEGGDRLFQNQMISEDGKEPVKRFEDVTQQAGIHSSSIGFGLDLMVGDVNDDHWPDIYISNDFFERDYLYLNNGDGSFSEQLPEATSSISLSSMGGDLADINGDALPDIYVTDMLPEELNRQKSTTTFDFWDDYIQRVNRGYHHQFVRNTLQLNRGSLSSASEKSVDTTNEVHFSEIGRLSGVYATDWSWSALIADLDLDAHNDIYVTNGIFKDLTNQDYVTDDRSMQRLRSVVEGDMTVQQLFGKIPSTPVSNYAFRSTGPYRFDNKAEEWGLAKPGFSNGAAYGDLDNDGDLDLVVNNVNAKANVYQNRSDTLKTTTNWLEIRLEGSRYNTAAVGTKVTLWIDDQTIFREQMPNRGYHSSVDPRLHFGLGEKDTIDSLKVRWPDGGATFIRNPKTNQLLTLTHSEAEQRSGSGDIKQKYQKNGKSSQIHLQNISSHVKLDYIHKENNFVDFERDNLVIHMHSKEGPAACVADINGDGKDDLYLGGAKGQAGSIYIQQESLWFEHIDPDLFKLDNQSEDTDCQWFDADSDGDQDLYVASGGSEFPSSSGAIADRLYLNDGTDNWIKAERALPISMVSPTATVEAGDFDGDGDMDLFVGQRLKSFAYGLPVKGHLLVNNGEGKYSDQTEKLAPALMELAPITDSKWVDYDADGDTDLIVAGEWMPVRLFENQLQETGSPRFIERTQALGLANTNGWWQSVEISDLNSDGYPEIIAGNQGLNTMLKATPQQPVKMYTGDFDQNGIAEQILTIRRDGKDIPLVLRQDLLRQLPSFEETYPSFESYADVTIEELLTESQRDEAYQRKIVTTESAVFRNKNGTAFERETLPVEAQFSPIYAISMNSIDQKRQNITGLLAGNLHGVKPQIGRYDASYGTTIEVDSLENITVIPHSISGFTVEGEVRVLLPVRTGNEVLYLVVRNGDSPVWFKRQNDN